MWDCPSAGLHIFEIIQTQSDDWHRVSRIISDWRDYKLANKFVNSSWSTTSDPEPKSARSEASRTYTWSVYPGNDRSLSPVAILLSIYTANTQRGRTYERPYDAHVSNISVQLLRRNLSNQFADDERLAF